MKNMSKILKDLSRNNRNLERTFARFRVYEKTEPLTEKDQKTYVIIKLNDEINEHQGLLSLTQEVLKAANEIRIAGFQPVVDFSDLVGKCMYFPRDEWLTGENPWDYFFKQPDKSDTLEKAYCSQHTRILRHSYGTMNNFGAYELFSSSPEQLRYWQKVVKRNLHLSDLIKSRVDSEKKKLFTGNEKVIGVSIRAGYRAGGLGGFQLLYDKHPVVRSCEEYIERTEKKMKLWGCTKVFLMIDDREYHTRFLEYFGKDLLYIDRPLARYFKDGKPQADEIKDVFLPCVYEELDEITEKERAADYLAEVYLLSMCDSLYCSLGTGQAFSYLLNNGNYHYADVDDSGRYTLSR